MELNRDNKFDKENIKEIDLMKLELEDVEDLMTAKKEVAFKDTKYCLNCKHIFNINDYRFEEEELCPYCHSDNYGDCYQDDLDTNTYETHINNVEDIREDVGDEIYNKICYIINNSDEYEELADYYRTKNYDLKKEGAIKQMGKKQNLEEATIKALYDGLKDNTEVDDVEGLVDDVLVVTDPEITTDEYNEVIERAEEIIEDTPEGEIPLDPTYLGEYLQICPICGGSFIEDHILEPGTACPICYETPESFVMVGKLQAEEVVAEDNGLESEEDVGEEEEFTPTPIEEFGAEETGEEETVEPETEPEGELPNEEPVEREERPRGARTRRNREVASKEIPQGNILTENTRLTEGLRDVDRENDKWYLNMGMTTSLSNMSDMEIEHYATWQEYTEICDIIETDEDLDTKIQKLNELKNSIDYKIKFAVDYASTSQEAIDKWLKYYKDMIDRYINALKNGDKYYIEISGRYNVDYNGEPDDEPFGFIIKIENGKFEKGTKYYDTEEEAKADMKTLSKDDITKYLKNIYGDRLWEWNVEVVKASMDMMINTPLNEDSDKKDDGKELLLGAEEDDKEYTIEEVGEDKIKELADKSAFTWEGAFTTDEALQKIVDDFKESTPIQLPVHFYTWKGKLFNEIYGLTGSNAYPDDLNFLSVDLDNWSEMGNLPIFKMKVRARWLDDIVDNNAIRQNEIDSKND